MMRNQIIRFLIVVVLKLLARIDIYGKENIPASGNFVVAANHLGLADALLAHYAIGKPNLFLLVGEKWGDKALTRWLGKLLDFVFIDRFNPDLRTIRKVMERMKNGDILVITPEGTRSKVGHLIEAKLGVSYLAAKAGYPILPVAVTGTSDEIVFSSLKRLRRPHITATGGKVFTLPPLPREGRDEALQQYTDEIMCRIAALLPEEYRGFYAGHPRLKELLREKT